MINFLSSWAEQVVLAVIIATIIELILPNSKNKKYVQMVIGVYVLFNIISPVIKNKDIFTFEEINLEKYSNSSNYEENNGQNYANNSNSEVDQTSMDLRLEKIYLEELENDIKTRFKEKNIEISKCTIDAELDTTKKNAGIHLITVKVKDSVDKEVVNQIKQEIIEEYEIDDNKVKITYK